MLLLVNSSRPIPIKGTYTLPADYFTVVFCFVVVFSSFIYHFLARQSYCYLRTTQAICLREIWLRRFLQFTIHQWRFTIMNHPYCLLNYTQTTQVPSAYCFLLFLACQSCCFWWQYKQFIYSFSWYWTPTLFLFFCFYCLSILNDLFIAYSFYCLLQLVCIPANCFLLF